MTIHYYIMDLLHFAALLLLLVIVCFGQPDVTFKTEEELSVGSLVGRISSARILSQVNPDEFDTLSYRLLSGSANGITYVRVDSASGNMYVNNTIDRETICGSTLQCYFDLSVAVNTLSNSFISVLSVRVDISDKNDNSPIFPVRSFKLQISEGSRPGSLFTLPTADDRDIGNNSVQDYALVPMSILFSLNVTKSISQTFSVKLQLNETLNRETQNQYSLQLEARDGGDPVRSDRITVIIEVLDENDNAPVFLEPFYNVDMLENSPANTLLLQVVASDLDVGDNSQVFYRFSQHQPYLDNVVDIFRLDSQTGEIRLTQPANGYKPNTTFRFYVEASDRGQEPQVTQVLVTVRVKDAGNNAPELIPSFFVEYRDNSCNVSESIKLGSPLVHIKVEDTDFGPAGNVTCSVDSTVLGLQTVSSANYFLIISQQLDYEQVAFYRVTLTCRDMASTPLSSSLVLDINVLDINDNDPEFEPVVYNTNVTENSGSGSTLCQVHASDKDKGDNSLIQYYLEDSAVPKFSINPRSGVITTRVTFDREITPSATILVYAVDGGRPARTGTGTVFVKILDLNDNTPWFSPETYQLHIIENQRTGTTVGIISADDPDDGPNGEVIYTVEGSLPSLFPFDIFSNGSIISTIVLDREHQTKYEFSIRATDQGRPTPKFSTTKVVITVVDVNDNRPVFVFPNDNNDTVYVNHKVSIPSKVITISAYDGDFGANRDLEYSIKQGNDLDLFVINPDTGSLFLQSAYEIEEDTKFSLVVCAIDKGKPQLEICHVMHVIMQISNATALQSSLPASNKFTVILAVVVVFTVVVSSVIILVIFLLRRKDLQKKREAMAMKDKELEVKQHSNMYTSPPPMYDVTQSVDSLAPLPGLGDTIRKKKKEVSFSLEEDNSLLDIPVQQNINQQVIS